MSRLSRTLKAAVDETHWDEFEPVSGRGDVYHAHEAGGELIVADGDCPVEFQTAEHALDAITLLVERPVMFDLYAAV